MTKASTTRRKWPALELFGILLAGTGLCFAIAFVGIGFSEEQLVKDKRQAALKLDEMRNALTAAKIPEEQITGLLRVHKAALAVSTSHEHFIVLSFSIL